MAHGGGGPLLGVGALLLLLLLLLLSIWSVGGHWGLGWRVRVGGGWIHVRACRRELAARGESKKGGELAAGLAAGRCRVRGEKGREGGGEREEGRMGEGRRGRLAAEATSTINRDFGVIPKQARWPYQYVHVPPPTTRRAGCPPPPRLPRHPRRPPPVPLALYPSCGLHWTLLHHRTASTGRFYTTPRPITHGSTRHALLSTSPPRSTSIHTLYLSSVPLATSRASAAHLREKKQQLCPWARARPLLHPRTNTPGAAAPAYRGSVCQAGRQTSRPVLCCACSNRLPILLHRSPPASPSPVTRRRLGHPGQSLPPT